MEIQCFVSFNASMMTWKQPASHKTCHSLSSKPMNWKTNYFLLSLMSYKPTVTQSLIQIENSTATVFWQNFIWYGIPIMWFCKGLGLCIIPWNIIRADCIDYILSTVELDVISWSSFHMQSCLVVVWFVSKFYYQWTKEIIFLDTLCVSCRSWIWLNQFSYFWFNWSIKM